MRLKAKMSMPIEDYILLYKLSKKMKCDIGTFIRQCLANYLYEHYQTKELEKLMNEPLAKKRVGTNC